MEEFEQFPSQKSRTAYVVDEVLGAIKANRYHAGDQLPSERVLAEQMKVGRAAVREALSALQVMGIVERRIGQGTYIKGSIDDSIGLEPTLQALRENRSLGEVWEARKSVEIILAKLAVEKADEDDIASLQDSLDRIAEALARGDYDDYADADHDFHLGLAKAAKNPFLQRAFFPLLAITHQQVATQVSSQYIREHIQSMIEEHRLILETIKRRQVSKIAQVIRHHFVASEQLFLNRKQ
ncbi:MAG: hypothetical protein DRO73_11800 [Candidatus Thorarchaeota archaeon]|nr:MAG: hypothetical protein DRO73_11800 [Candidatus Thorarchaeota archaeon]